MGTRVPPEVKPRVKARGKDLHGYKLKLDDIGMVSEPARESLEE